jgi:hypothetical protein
MTINEKIKMYRGKKEFIDGLSRVFEAGNSNTSVTSVDYEVYRKDIDEDRIHFTEYLVVNYFGGGKSVRNINGNSNSTNFRELGKLLDGGYYEELKDYESLATSGYFLVTFQNNLMLEKLLSKPFETLEEIQFCFNYCKDKTDIELVIKAIPKEFGKFIFELFEEDTFSVSRGYEDSDCYQIVTTDYNFYKGE